MNEILSQEGYEFSFDASECTRCNGFCCRGESGYIWINYQEIQALANHLQVTLDELALNYLKKVKHRYSIREKKLGEDDYACIFFDDVQKGCSIYEARPNQCKTFPFWEQFKCNKEEAKQECPGIR